MAGKKYGDLISASAYGLCLTAILVRECLDPSSLSSSPRRLVVPVILSHIGTVLCGFASYLKGTSTLFSVLTIVGDVVTIIFLNAANFLQYESSSLLMELVWVYLMISANLDTSFQTKAALSIFTLVVSLTVALRTSLLPIDYEETATSLVLCTALHIGLHYIGSTTLYSDQFTVQGARVVLAAVFLQHVWSEISIITQNPDKDVNASTYQAVKACVLAVVGLASIGTFSSNIDEKNSLTRLVDERTREIIRQQDELHLVGLALQASETAIAITDHEQCIVWSNPALQRITMGAHKDLVNVPIPQALNLTPENAHKLYRAFVADRRHEEEISIGESIYNVEVTPSSSVSSSTAFNNTEQQRFVVALKDVTEYRKLQIAEKAAEREAMMAKAMGESMEVLTHELRTPLQGIMGITSMLIQDDTLHKGALDLLELVMASSGLLLVLINNLLDIRKCNANMMDDFQLQPIPSAPTMKDSVDFCQPLAAISQVNIKLDYEETRHAVVFADNLRLQQCLINLVSNGIKYTPSGGDLRLRTRVCSFATVRKMMHDALANGGLPGETVSDDGEVLVFEVIDSGSGIPPGQEAFLFRKFAQLNNGDKSRKRGKNTVGQPHGTGLGLNLVQKFTQMMNGYIWVKNNAGTDSGATFAFCLPLMSNNPNEKSAHSSSSTASLSYCSDSFSSSQESQSASRSASFRVLLVDDTLINRKVFAKMIKLVPSVKKLTTVESGHRALQELETGDYNFVISDVQMPEMDGFELSRRIQCDFTSPPVVIGLTADTSQHVAEKCMASGMADVLYKPITVAEMNDYFENNARKLVRK